MKTGFASEFNAVSKFDQGAVCGFIQSNVGQPPASAWNDAGNFKWAVQCDFVGRDLMSKATTSDTCGSTCASTTGCSHFVWTNYQVSLCLGYLNFPLSFHLLFYNKCLGRHVLDKNRWCIRMRCHR